MIRTCDNGHPPARVLSGTPCKACERRRGTTASRGYGYDHQAARRVLVSMLPLPCAYGCGTVLREAAGMVAAHRVDGDSSAGWVASCRSCNERAKDRGWGGIPDGTPGALTRARQSGVRPGFRVFSETDGESREDGPRAPTIAYVPR